MQASFLAEKALGYVQLDATAGITLTTAPDAVASLLVSPETAACRWRDDGIMPTASIGFPLAVGQVLNYTGANIKGLKFFGVGSILNINYYG